MSRYFALQTWVGSHENEPDYDGNQCGSRNVRSVEAIPLYDIYGKANVNAFSEAAITARMGKTPTKVPLKQRILPQSARVEKLRSEAIELEAAFKAGEFTPEEYTLLRDVQFKKLRRAEELLKKAITPVKTEDEYEEVGVETTYNSCDVDYAHTDVATPCGVSWIDELSPRNSFKKILQITCKVAIKLVHFSQRAKAYYQTLKEV